MSNWLSLFRAISAKTKIDRGATCRHGISSEIQHFDSIQGFGTMKKPLAAKTSLLDVAKMERLTIILQDLTLVSIVTNDRNQSGFIWCCWVSGSQPCLTIICWFALQHRTQIRLALGDPKRCVPKRQRQGLLMFFLFNNWLAKLESVSWCILHLPSQVCPETTPLVPAFVRCRGRCN